jgi:GntR family transcriptional regulator, transcriptional repressor for pyruvate dehydrogenase complex
MNMQLPRTLQLSRSRLFEKIASIILKRIIRGEIPVGERLPTERTLAADFQVNRSTVREALKKLESLQVIEIRHGDGVYVKNYLESPNLELINALFYMDNVLDTDILETLLQVRRILVPEMASIAALNRSEGYLKDLEETAYNSNELTVLDRDLKVHHIIALASGNILYLILLNFFNRFFHEFGHLYFDEPENAERSVRFHKEIFEAIRDKDQARSRQIMVDVLVYAEDAILAVVKHLKERGEVL